MSDSTPPVVSISRYRAHEGEAVTLRGWLVQKRSSGTVQPDAWTHGSSAQRKKWLATGFNTGDPNQCDPFATNNLG